VSDLAVTLTVDQLRELVRAEVRSELAKLPMSGAKEVLELNEVAELLGRHPRTIKQLIDERGLPVRYISAREPRFLRSKVLTWLESLPAKLAEKAA
jgi:hypothetical protein